MDNQSDPEGAAESRPPQGNFAWLPAWLRRQPIWLKAVLAMVLVIALGSTAYAFSQLGRGGQPAPTASGTTTAEGGTATPSPSEPAQSPTQEPPPAAMNILLMGSDSRGDSRAEEAQAAAGTPADQRADVLMLIHIPADRQKIYGISIMRDTWVNIPDHGEAKINAGLELGGIPLMVRTVESLFNTHIDHTVMTDFAGFKRATDALGGVDVNVTLPFTSTHDSGHTFTPGINRLTGDQALEFVRERYAFADGDFQRIRNQQTFLKSLVGKFMSAGTLTNPNTVVGVIQAVRPHLIIDQGLTLDDMWRLGFSLRDVGPEDAIFFRLPDGGFGFSTDGQSIVFQNPDAIGAVSAALANGTLADYVAANGLEGGN
ncbi:LCP family protein required for cell wall assembly [Arthrobacter sp. PvP023]|uniref:LCP family protein n=1 Tax=Micrococcaceae TaxID=1268 RepID=UPI001AE85BCA|nr:LCP family protein [Arthrobacter sp. PvP023]MBP1135051.1 LCP family protein required for cell wall assembly [Arthrobacter sp. PvP023]